MYNPLLHKQLNELLDKSSIAIASNDRGFYTRFIANIYSIEAIYLQLYGNHKTGKESFIPLLTTIIQAYKLRSEALKKRDNSKTHDWFLSNEIVGMSLYVDRFAGSLQDMPSRLAYLEELGVNFLHLMPLFQSPANESDGGYAVSNFRVIDAKFGTIEQLQNLQKTLQEKGMYLMLDIVLNHTSQQHEWAMAAKAGDKHFQDFYYCYDDRNLPNAFEATMPEIFPESAPGSFTYNHEMQKWVMTVFHNYQWDLNFTNPAVLIAMLDTIYFYANLGVDILRIDAPAFIWKQLGTACQNLPEAHQLLRLIKLCVEIATPGMALLGEAIVAPKEIMKYFGTGAFTAKECDVAYNATHMALQWDALATGNVMVMLAAQQDILQKPLGTTWITYTRCHDDIGLGYEDSMISNAGFNAYEHRMFLKEYYAGTYPNSPATGALFGVNPKTQDARISGTLASLCGLEKALLKNDSLATQLAIKKVLLMQAHSIFLGGIPMLFYGDEVGYTNDYSYLQDGGKSYDNRWMHRPIIDWDKQAKRLVAGSVEQQVFTATKQLLTLRKALPAIADKKNIEWLHPHNIHVAGYKRSSESQTIFCLYNFNGSPAFLTWYAFKEKYAGVTTLFDHYSKTNYTVGRDDEFFILDGYGFYILEVLIN